MCVISKQWWHTEAILILAQHRTIPGTARATITACLLTKQVHGAEDSQTGTQNVCCSNIVTTSQEGSSSILQSKWQVIFKWTYQLCNLKLDKKFSFAHSVVMSKSILWKPNSALQLHKSNSRWFLSLPSEQTDSFHHWTLHEHYFTLTPWDH